MPTLTVLMVTEYEDAALPFIERAHRLASRLAVPFVLAVDRHAATTVAAYPRGARIVDVDSRGAGYLEAVLNDALDACDTEYVFRIDDDEAVSGSLADWLRAWGADPAPLYAFPRAALWPDAGHRIAQVPWWPDAQARLATRELSRRSRLHEMWACEEVYVPHPIVHYSYLCHDAEWHERRRAAYAIARPDCVYPMPDDTTRVVDYDPRD